jgi:hypothetical protein
VRKIDTVALEDATRWAVWTFQNTNMPKARIWARAKEKFGVPMAAVERCVVARLEERDMTARTVDLMEQFQPKHANGKGPSVRMHYAAQKHLRSI